MKQFKVQSLIKYGEDSLEYIEKLNYKKIMIVTDKTMVKLELVDKITKRLVGKSIEIFDKVEPNPTVEIIETGIIRYISFKPDCIIALGGGSPIDACKAILYFGYRVEKEYKGKYTKIPFIAIPTTSGTGSEVTSYSVITKGDKKLVLADDDMLPTVSLLNPSFMKKLPKFVIADTGMDVLTHALEAYVSKEKSIFTDIYAIEAIKIIYNELIKHYNDSTILEYRSNIQKSSTLAGIAFNNASLGINHSIAHTLGANLHISHGRANAIVMPYVIEYNSNAYENYFKVCSELGIKCSNIKEGKNKLINIVLEMNNKLHIEKSIQELKVDFEQYEKLIPTFVEDIENDTCTKGNPNISSREKLIELLINIYFGKIG